MNTATMECRPVLTLAVMAVFWTCVDGQNYLNPQKWTLDGNYSEELLDRLGKMDGLLDSFSKLFKNNTFKYPRTVQGVRPSCISDLWEVLVGIFSKKLQAFRFLDADFKPESGILNGNLVWTGDYSECISTKLTHHRTNRIVRGKYFSVLLKVKISSKNMKIIGGLCLPDSCDETDTKNLITLSMFSRKSMNEDVSLTVYGTTPQPLSSGAISAIIVIAFMVACVTVGTGFDVVEKYLRKNIDETSTDEDNKIEVDTITIDENAKLLNEGKSNTVILRIFKAFSIFENTKKLMNTSTFDNPLACLNGLRVISMTWVILGHAFLFSLPTWRNVLFVTDTLTKRWTFEPIMNGTFSVDTFFFISGLLVAYLTLNEMKSKGRLNWFYYFGHRFWRLTPLYAFLLFFYTTMTSYLVSGPFRWAFSGNSDDGQIDHQNCKRYWWTNLLYINNLYPNYGKKDACMNWTWYLANDMQFYVFIAPVVILLLRKLKVVGVVYSTLLILVCISIRAWFASYFGMTQIGGVTKHKDSPWAEGFLSPTYTYPFTRWSTYIVGMVTGFILHKTNCRIRMHKVLVVIGWIVSISCGLSVIYGLHYYYHTGTNASPVVSVFYIATSRTAWSFCLAWLVIACASGHGGWINDILSWKLWAPLGRLTYAAYLNHVIVYIWFFGNQTTRIMYTDPTVIYIFIGSLVLTYGSAYVVSMLVEAPMIQLEKVILGR